MKVVEYFAKHMLVFVWFCSNFKSVEHGCLLLWGGHWKKSAMRAHKIMNAARRKLLRNLAPKNTSASSGVVKVKRRSNNNVGESNFFFGLSQPESVGYRRRINYFWLWRMVMMNAFGRCNNIHISFLRHAQSVGRPLARWRPYHILQPCEEVVSGMVLDVTREENRDGGTTFVPQRTYFVVET